MKRLLISALLAILVHGYLLRSNIGERDVTSQGKAAKSVVISLATVVQSPVSRLTNELNMDAKPISQPLAPVAVAQQPVNNERKGVPSDGEGPLEQDGSMTYGPRFELEAENDSIKADHTIIKQDDLPVAMASPKAGAETHENMQVERKEDARNTRQQTQTAKPENLNFKAKRVEREYEQIKLTKPQVGYYETGEGAPDSREKPQPEQGVDAKRDTLIKQALEGVLHKARPLYKQNPRPPYPRVARIRGYEGTVIVKALVGIDGLVSEVRLDESSGHETLDVAASKTVQRWAFEPAARGTKKVEMWVKIPLRFSLE